MEMKWTSKYHSKIYSDVSHYFEIAILSTLILSTGIV